MTKTSCFVLIELYEGLMDTLKGCEVNMPCINRRHSNVQQCIVSIKVDVDAMSHADVLEEKHIKIRTYWT